MGSSPVRSSLMHLIVQRLTLPYKINSLAILLPSYTASTFAESMLFGAYAVVFLMGAWSLLHLSYLRRPSGRDLIILSFNTVMFLLALSVSDRVFVLYSTVLTTLVLAYNIEHSRHPVQQPRRHLEWDVQRVQYAQQYWSCAL